MSRHPLCLLLYLQYSLYSWLFSSNFSLSICCDVLWDWALAYESNRLIIIIFTKTVLGEMLFDCQFLIHTANIYATEINLNCASIMTIDVPRYSSILLYIHIYVHLYIIRVIRVNVLVYYEWIIMNFIESIHRDTNYMHIRFICYFIITSLNIHSLNVRCAIIDLLGAYTQFFLLLSHRS